MESKIIAQVNNIKRKIKESQPKFSLNSTGENEYFGINIDQFGRRININFVDSVSSYTSRGL